MLKNKILLIIFFVVCTILSETKIVFAQEVTDNSKDTQINAALNAKEQAVTNTESSQPEPQPAAAENCRNIHHPFEKPELSS